MPGWIRSKCWARQQFYSFSLLPLTVRSSGWGEGVFQQWVTCLPQPMVKPYASRCAGTLMLVLRQARHCHKTRGRQGWHQFLGTAGVRARRSWWKAEEGILAWPSKLSWWILFALHFGLIWGSYSLVSSWSLTETTCDVGRGRTASPASCWDERWSMWCRSERNPLAPPAPIFPQNYSPPPQRDLHHTSNLSISQPGPIFSLPFPLSPWCGGGALLPR